jgi:hypothetical protein
MMKVLLIVLSQLDQYQGAMVLWLATLTYG